MIKLETKDGKWFVNDNGELRVFDRSTDAWDYIFRKRRCEHGVSHR